LDDRGRAIRPTGDQVRAKNALALAALDAILEIGDDAEQSETLDYLKRVVDEDRMTQAVLDEAAVLWAAVRNAGLMTAHPTALDGDAILAAQTILVADSGDVVTIATDNPRHLSRFPGIDARPWRSITS